MSGTEAADVVRWVYFVIGGLMIGVIVGLALMLLRRLSLEYNVEQRVLPAHVVGASISYVIILIGSCAEAVVRLGDPPTWRIFLYPFGTVIGAVSVLSLWNHFRSHPPFEPWDGSERRQGERRSNGT